MRPKKDQKMDERLENMLKVPLFDKLRDKDPDALNKVIAIGGDIQSHALGISADDEKMLIKNVSIVFHAAATVRFDEKIRVAVEINVKGTQRLLDLCHQMEELKVSHREF